MTKEYDAYKTGIFDASIDLGDAEVIDREIEDVRAGRVEYAHLGLLRRS